MKIRIFLSLLILFLESCGNTYECPKENLFPAYISYADAEVDTVILRRFQPGSNFAQKIDSIILTSANSAFSRQSDTVTIFSSDLKNRINDNKYDWQVFNPFNKKTVSISNMEFQIEEQKSGGLFSMDPSSCFSPLISYKRDNIVTTVPNTGNKYLYINR